MAVEEYAGGIRRTWAVDLTDYPRDIDNGECQS